MIIEHSYGLRPQGELNKLPGSWSNLMTRILATFATLFTPNFDRSIERYDARIARRRRQRLGC